MKTARLAAALAAGVVLMSAPQAADPQAPRVRILEPAAGAYLTGRTALVAELESADPIQRVEFMVDGLTVATLTGPPWRVLHDFGAAIEAHLIRVVARTTSGASGDDTVTTRPLRVNQVAEVELVNVFATVLDRRDRYVMDLIRDDFLIFEDGKRQSLTHFSRDRLPLSVFVVLDTSLSMEGRSLAEARAAASAFLQALEGGDQAGVIAFSDRVQVLHPLADDLVAARDSIGATVARGGTALYDAVAEAARLLKPAAAQRRRPALVVLSDGRDEAASGLTPGSVLTFEETLEEAVQSGIILYAVGLGKDLDKRVDFYGQRSLEEVLQTLAGETGGRAYFTARAAKLKETYDLIATELRHHYSLAYSSTNGRRDGGWRAIDLRVARGGLSVRARSGYYAPDAGLP